MPRLTHPATGRTIDVPETRARVHRKHGWTDVDAVPDGEIEFTGLEDLTPELVAELTELATGGPITHAGDGNTETPEV